MTIDFPCNGCIENTKGQIAKKYIKKIEVREAIEKKIRFQEDCIKALKELPKRYDDHAGWSTFKHLESIVVLKELLHSFGLDGEQK